jgi:hypothetical protein
LVVGTSDVVTLIQHTEILDFELDVMAGGDGELLTLGKDKTILWMERKMS